MRGASFNKVFQMSKDAEATCAHLLANAKVVEGQYKALRAEHEMLRIEADTLRFCLDKAGILPSAVFDEELKRRGAERPQEALAPVDLPHRAQVANPSPKAQVKYQAPAQAPAPAPAQSPANQAPRREQRATFPRMRNSSSPPRGRSPPPGAPVPSQVRAAPASPKDLPDVHIETDMEQAVPAECEFQNLLQATLEGSPDLSQQALRALQTLLRFKPEAIKLGNAKASPLTTAVRAGNVECTKVLLKARASPNEQDDKGVSPLHLATFDGNPDLCKALLFYRADVDACDRHGQAPLFFAPSKDVCKLLLERKSDVNILNRRGQSALHMAGRAGLHEVLGWLSQRVSQTLCDLKDVHGITAKNYAKMSGVPLPIPAPIPVRSTRSPSPQSQSKGGGSTRNSPQSGMRSGSLRSGSASRKDRTSAHAFDFFEVASSPAPTSPPRRQDAVAPESVSLPGQLPCHSTLVGGTPPPPPTEAESMYAAFDSLERLQKLRSRSPTCDANTVALAAAAAVASAAVSTAAELTPGSLTEGAERIEPKSTEGSDIAPEQSMQARIPQIVRRSLTETFEDVHAATEAAAQGNDLSEMGIYDESPEAGNESEAESEDEPDGEEFNGGDGAQALDPIDQLDECY